MLPRFTAALQAAQGGGCPGPTAQQAEQAGIALLRMIDKVNAALVGGRVVGCTGLRWPAPPFFKKVLSCATLQPAAARGCI